MRDSPSESPLSNARPHRDPGRLLHHGLSACLSITALTAADAAKETRKHADGSDGCRVWGGARPPAHAGGLSRLAPWGEASLRFYSIALCTKYWLEAFSDNIL